MRSGHITAGPVLVAIAGLVLISVLIIRKIPGAILLGIVITAIIGFLTRTTPTPEHFVSLPPSLGPILWQLDFRGVLTWQGFPIVFTIFIMAFVDTMGT